MKLLRFGLLVAIAGPLFGCDRNVTYEEQVVQASTCFNCHSDQDTRLVAAEQQYAFSVHASGTAVSEPNDPCSGCHTSEGFIQRIETGTIPETVENPTAINCFTCHQPHTSGTLERRVEDPYPLANGTTFDLSESNICSACHQARRDVGVYVSTPTGRVNLTSRWGPHHGPQSDMLIGTNGFEYPTYTYEQTEHRTATDDGCLDCHMKDPENLRVGGHSFNMAFDAGGGDVMVNTAACADCHGELDDFDYNGCQTQTDSLAADLRGRLVAAGLLNDATGLPRSVETSSDSAGAVWNYLMAVEDRSKGVHNRKYIQGLLTSGIAYISGSLEPAAMAAR